MNDNERYEVDNNGNLVVGIPQTCNDREKLIKLLFERNGWSYELVNKVSNSHYLIKLNNRSIDKEYVINLYHGNIRKEDPNRNREEKKIQLGGLDPRNDFLESTTIILGIYVYENGDEIDDAVIVAWPIEMNKNYQDNPSLRVNMKRDILPGKNMGFYFDDLTGKKLCVFRPEFIYYYLENHNSFHAYNSDTKENSICVNKEKGINKIIYGTPGCGKSYYVHHKLLKDYPKHDDNFETVVRTTFYQDYTNTDFVGQLLPHLEKDENGKEMVTYEFNPGPFTIALKMAFENPDKPVALVIEELNRGNAASIFGDIFQLLDRKKSGESEYEIHNVNIQDYLNNELKERRPFDCVKIPSNLSIFATMNTSDQNVFTLDTAFKRRWEFEKLPNEFDNNHPYAHYKVPGMKMDCNWYAIVKAINKYIVENKNSLTSEDKQIGVFFVKDNMLINPENEKDNDEKTKKFAYKMIEYLWNDVAKYDDRSKWFNGAETLDEALKNYENNGNVAFNKDLIEKVKEYMAEYKSKTEKKKPEEEDNNAQ